MTCALIVKQKQKIKSKAPPAPRHLFVLLLYMCHVSPTTKATVTDPPPANSPTKSSELGHKDRTQKPKLFSNLPFLTLKKRVISLFLF